MTGVVGGEVWMPGCSGVKMDGERISSDVWPFGTRSQFWFWFSGRVHDLHTYVVESCCWNS